MEIQLEINVKSSTFTIKMPSEGEISRRTSRTFFINKLFVKLKIINEIRKKDKELYKINLITQKLPISHLKFLKQVAPRYQVDVILQLCKTSSQRYYTNFRYLIPIKHLFIIPIPIYYIIPECIYCLVFILRFPSSENT